MSAALEMFVDGVTVGRTTVMGVVEVCSSLAIVASFLSSSPCFFFFLSVSLY